MCYLPTSARAASGTPPPFALLCTVCSPKVSSTRYWRLPIAPQDNLTTQSTEPILSLYYQQTRYPRILCTLKICTKNLHFPKIDASSLEMSKPVFLARFDRFWPIKPERYFFKCTARPPKLHQWSALSSSISHRPAILQSLQVELYAQPPNTMIPMGIIKVQRSKPTFGTWYTLTQVPL